jgi:hypothetical protein
MYPPARGGIDCCASPRRALGVANFKPIPIRVWSRELHAAAHAWTSIGATVAVSVIGGRALDETGEDGMDDGRSTRVWARLETSVTDVRLANKLELLGKVVAGAVGGRLRWKWGRLCL